MYEAGHRALVVCFNGHDIAVGAHGDDGLLQGLGVGGGGDDLLQRVPGPGGGGAHLPADVRQLGAGGVGDLILPHDGGEDFFLQELVGPQTIKQGVDGGLPHAVLGDIAPDQAGALKHPGDIQQLPGVQRAAQVRAGQGGPHVLDPGKGGAAAHHHHGLGGAGLLQAALDLKGIGRGRRAAGPAPPGRSPPPGGEHLQHRGQLQRLQGFFKKFIVSLVFIHFRNYYHIFSVIQGGEAPVQLGGPGDTAPRPGRGSPLLQAEGKICFRRGADHIAHGGQGGPAASTAFPAGLAAAGSSTAVLQA